MKDKIILFKQNYYGESLNDVDRDVSEAFNSDFNELMNEVPHDEHGFHKGTFTITIEWTKE